jgi:hypothetical protein
VRLHMVAEAAAGPVSSVPARTERYPMTATTTVLVPLQPAFGDAERLALAGFLAGYPG